MIVIVRNKVFSLTGSSTVKDEAGKDVYRVKGKLRLFSPTRKKKIYDMVLVAVSKETLYLSIKDGLLRHGIPAEKIIWKKPQHPYKC